MPLWHQRDVRRGDGQVAEIGDRDRLPRDTRVDDGQFHMIAFEQLTQQPEFVEELERRGMDRVAPEIAEEIGVLFEHDRLDPGARERSEEHTSELQSLMRISSAVFCLKKKTTI